MDAVNKLTQWFTVDSNVENAAQVLVNVSRKDRRRLKTKAHHDENSIWGQCSVNLFEVNDEVHRLFLYTVWTQNKRIIQEKFSTICGRRYVPVAEVVGDLYCVCKKKYENIDPLMVECSGCRNWFHCICVGLTDEDIEELPEYICEYCRKLEDPPTNHKLPETSKAEFSFLQLQSQEQQISSPLFSSTPIIKPKQRTPPRRCHSPGPKNVNDSWSYPVEDQSRDALITLHWQCEKLKMMDEAFEEPLNLPTLFPADVAEQGPNNQHDDDGAANKIISDDEKIKDTSTVGDTCANPEVKGKEDENEDKQNQNDDFKAQGEVDTDSLETEEDYKKVPSTFNFLIPYENLRKFIKLDNLDITTEKGTRTCRKLAFFGQEHASVLRKEFVKTNPFCSIFFDKKFIRQDHELVTSSSSQVRIYAKCKRKGCTTSYAFHINRVPKLSQDVKVSVTQTHKIQHDNKLEKATTALRGAERSEMKVKLKHESALKVQKELASKANQRALNDGNRGVVYALTTLRKAKSEVKHESDRSSDPYADLLLTKLFLDENMKDLRIVGYVQDLGCLPFRMLLFSNASVEVFHKFVRTEKYPTLVIDATDPPMAKFVSPLDDKKPLLYTILPARASDNESELPIAEFVSTSHTFADVSGFFLQFFERYKRVYNNPSPHYGVARVECDFSKTIIAAAIHVFCRRSTVEFFNDIWKNCIDEQVRQLRKKPFAVHVCRFHVLRFLKMYFLKSYHKSADQLFILNVWSIWAHAFVASYDMYSLTRRIRDAYIIAGSYYFTNEVAQCIENISEPTDRTEFCPWMVFEEEHLEEEAPFHKKSIFGQYSTTFYDSVHLYSEFLKNSDGAKLPEFERALNPYYSESLCHYMKIQIFPYIPVLTRTQFFLYDLPLTEDTTNRCERYHNSMKNVYHNGNYQQRAARFVEGQNTWIQGTAKLILSHMRHTGKSQRSQQPPEKPKEDPSKGKATLLDQFRQQMTKDIKKQAAKPVANQPKFDRQSPEQSTEKFKTRQHAPTVKKAESILFSLPFIKWGGLIYLNRKLVQLSNTCNFDTTLTVLNVLQHCSSVGKSYLSTCANVGSDIKKVLVELSQGRINNAKEIFVRDVLKIKESHIVNGRLDLMAEERDTGFRAIADWMNVLRRQRCTNPNCAAYRSFNWKPSSWDFSSDDIPLDISIRNTTLIHRGTVAEMLQTLNEELDTEEWAAMETKCFHCRNDCYVSYYFPGGPPDIVFYPLNALGATCDTNKTVPTRQTIQGVEYNLFAVSIFEKIRQHYMSIIYHEDRALVYDGLRYSFSQPSASLDLPVTGVWLVKAN